MLLYIYKIYDLSLSRDICHECGYVIFVCWKIITRAKPDKAYQFNGGWEKSEEKKDLTLKGKKIVRGAVGHCCLTREWESSGSVILYWLQPRSRSQQWRKNWEKCLLFLPTMSLVMDLAMPPGLLRFSFRLLSFPLFIYDVECMGISQCFLNLDCGWFFNYFYVSGVGLYTFRHLVCAISPNSVRLFSMMQCA